MGRSTGGALQIFIHLQLPTEIPYGLPTRSFNSFLHAAEEAAISRLYGGIHYMMAIEEGVIQGDQIGKHIVEKLTSKIETNQKRSN